MSLRVSSLSLLIQDLLHTKNSNFRFFTFVLFLWTLTFINAFQIFLCFKGYNWSLLRITFFLGFIQRILPLLKLNFAPQKLFFALFLLFSNLIEYLLMNPILNRVVVTLQEIKSKLTFLQLWKLLRSRASCVLLILGNLVKSKYHQLIWL